ncbi:MAG: hypothetical protein ABIR96_00680 [Bdellovibrionota bacterium]
MHFSFKFNSQSLRIALLSSCGVFSIGVQAWGNRGHHAICDASTFLVKEEALKTLLAGMGPRMGHVCNVPDIFWRGLDPSFTKLGNPTHYINSDVFGKALKDVPEAYDKSVKHGDVDAHTKAGSLWWRAKQFFDRAVADAKSASKSKRPKNPFEEQNATLPYNRGIFSMLTDMALMGHFVGDVSMPYHSQTDHDGAATGHGGIHGFYEDTCVNTFGPDLAERIRAAAEQLKDNEPRPRSDVIASMRAMSLFSVLEVPKIEDLDQILAPSGSERRSALRKAPAQACPVFQDMIIQDMARSARLLASLWDAIYREGGRPQLDAYKSYRYPLEPDFVAPDYF